MNTRYSCLAGALLAAVPPFAVSAPEERAAVVVTATRTAQLADEVLAPMVVITKEDIARRQGSDVADLLRFHAGFDIGRNGGPGQATSLFLRGTASNHTLVMIDGVRVNPGTIGGAAIHNLDPALIERIEVVKGPRSTLYGSDAIGGVVNVITRQAESGTQANASAGGGSFGTQRYSAGASHARDGTRFGLQASSYRTDGFPPRIGSDIDRGHENVGFNAHAGRRFGPIDLELGHFQATGTTEYLDFFLAPVDQDFRNSVTALRLEAEPGANWATRLQLSRMLDEIDQNQLEDYAHSERWTVDWQNDVQLGRAQLLTGGVQLAREDTSALTSGTGYDEERDIKAVFLQDSIELGSHRWLVAARYTDYEGFGGHTTWDLEYGYWLSQATRVTAAAGTAFRAPDATDRFGFGGDPDLEPEESRNVELGIRHHVSPAQRVSLQVFQNDIDNLIEFDFIGAGGMVNLGEARVRGAELAWQYAAGRWRIGTEATVQDPVARATGNQLPRRAKRSVTATLAYTADRYQLGADVLATSSRRDSDFSDAVLSGYGLANLTGAWFLNRDWTLRARLENAFDRDYNLAGGFNTAERSWLLQLAWRYDAGARSLQ